MILPEEVLKLLQQEQAQRIQVKLETSKKRNVIVNIIYINIVDTFKLNIFVFGEITLTFAKIRGIMRKNGMR